MNILKRVFFELKVRFTNHYFMVFAPLLQLYLFYHTIFKGMKIYYGKYEECPKEKYFFGRKSEIILIALFFIVMIIMDFTFYVTVLQWFVFLISVILSIRNYIKYKKIFVPK